MTTRTLSTLPDRHAELLSASPPRHDNAVTPEEQVTSDRSVASVLPVITIQTTVNELAQLSPRAIRVFDVLGIDYCCHARDTLAHAARAAGADPGEVADLILMRPMDDGDRGLANWNEVPLKQLTAFVVAHHHRRTRRLLIDLMELAMKVTAAHGRDHSDLMQIVNVIDHFVYELVPHMVEEERFLFPYMSSMDQGADPDDQILVPMFGTVAFPLQSILHDHSSDLSFLDRVRELTNEFTPPETACGPMRELYAMMLAFHRELNEHIRFENDVLFPRALAIEISSRGKAAGDASALPERSRKSSRSVLDAEEATHAANMLSQASALLASSLDYETTLESLARLSTAAFADWCAVDLVNDDGSIRHLTVSHANPVLRDLALEFQQAAFSEPECAPGAPQALRLRKSVLLTDIAESQLTGVQPEAKITQLIGALGVRSLISVPLMVRDKVLGTMTFSSSRRRYEPVDLKLAEELSQRAAVAIDTAMLFREAQSANRYKDAFLGTVAHELRTPLTSIIGWVQMAKNAPNLRDEAIVQIEQSANLLRVFTEDLLDVTRIREQKLSMEMAEIDLAAIVRSAFEIMAPSASEHGIQVRLHIVLDPAPLSGDKVRLLQVVWNLLSNAIKFTPPGGEIDVRLERDGNDARLSVIDTGAGIEADFAPHVFELYRQADKTASHMPGLGIGLSIVAQILKLHGGTVRVESPGAGRGSTFIVTLPLLVTDPAIVAAARSEEPS